jgi:hypothetical protein
VNKTNTLGKLFLKLEFRGKDGSAKKIILVLLSYFVFGFMVSFFTYEQTLDSTGFEFAFLTYLLFSIVIIFAAMTELDNLIISAAEIEILSMLPIDNNVIAKAKLYMLGLYIFTVSIPLLLPGSYFFYLGVRSVPHAVMYAAGGFLLFIFLMHLLLLVYSIALRNVRAERVGSFTLILQALLILILILSYQFVSFSFSTGSGGGVASVYSFLETSRTLQYFPQSWFAGIAAKGQYILNWKLVLKYILPLIIPYLAYLSFRYYLTDNYGAIYEKLQYRVHPASGGTGAERKEYREPGDSFVRMIHHFASASERAAFSLMRNMLKRDKSVKLNVILMFIIPTALTLFALLSGQMYSPFIQFFTPSRAVFHISILITALIALNAAATGIKVSNEPQATWVYDAYPIGRKKEFINGVRKFFIVYFIFPLFVFLLIIFSLRMSVYDALLHAAFIATAVNLFNTFYHLFSRTLPFTKMNTILNSVQRIAALGLPLAIGVIFVVLQYYVYQKKWLVIIAVGAMGLINLGITRPQKSARLLQFKLKN